MTTLRISLAMAISLTIYAAPAFAQPGSPATESTLCKPDAKLEILSEGQWYPGVVLDALRDGRCFIHYDGYGPDDDEALTSQFIRAPR